MSYYFKSSIFQQEKEPYVHGFKVMEIKPSDIAKIPIVFPSKEDQQIIVFHLDSLSSNIRKLEELQQKTLTECDALKQAMLREVFE
jgi:type I restriction enzyme S subunit